jgi:hypothetical protein
MLEGTLTDLILIVIGPTVRGSGPKGKSKHCY